MNRLRPGDWICGLGGLALLAVLFLTDDDWGALTWFSAAFAALAILAALAVPYFTATRNSPSSAVLAQVAATVLGLVTLIAVLIEGEWLALAAVAVLVSGAVMSMRDESPRGERNTPVERRPAPPPGVGDAPA